MKTKTAFSWIAAANLIFCSAIFAAGAKTHEVTGTVLETTPTKIVVQKGAERWEIDLDPQTKVSGEFRQRRRSAWVFPDRRSREVFQTILRASKVGTSRKLW